MSAAADPYRPYRLVGTVLALAVIFACLAEFLWNAQAPTDRDFVSFWGAAQLAWAGDAAAAYDLDTLSAVQSTAVTSTGGKMPFPYAPAFLLLVMPFGLLGFAPAMALWAATGFAAYLTLIRRMFPGSGLLAAGFPVVFANAAIGQNGFVTASLFIGGLLLLQRRPFAAGILLGCLIIKPQLGLLLPVALLAARQWRAIAGAALSSLGVLLLGLLLFGLEANQAWLAQMPLYVSVTREGLVGTQKLASLYVAAKHVGIGDAAALALHAAVAIPAACCVWRVWRSDAEPLGKASVLAAATMLASPYLYLYDAVILAVPLLWLAQRGAPLWQVGLLWCLPMVSIAQIAAAPSTPNLMFLGPVLILALAVSTLSRRPHPYLAGA